MSSAYPVCVLVTLLAMVKQLRGEEPVRVISQDSSSNKQHEEESNHGAGSSHPYGRPPKVGILGDWLKWQLSTERSKVGEAKEKGSKRERVWKEIYGHITQVEWRAAQEG
ncbi:hypothetical protein BHE74_00004419 [Ensete ventricosum]|nr:hypothetical protein BHE74_00004419 [Ensete ventricosum]